MGRLILRKTNYKMENGIVVPEVFITPVGLAIEQARMMSMQHVYSVYLTLADLEAHTNLVEQRQIFWLHDEANLPVVLPELYAIITGAMLQAGQARKDIAVDEDTAHNVSWFDGAEVYTEGGG